MARGVGGSLAPSEVGAASIFTPSFSKVRSRVFCGPLDIAVHDR